LSISLCSCWDVSEVIILEVIILDMDGIVHVDGVVVKGVIDEMSIISFGNSCAGSFANLNQITFSSF
jgi:hypothetical protein